MWTLLKSMDQRLRAARRRMLRYVFRIHQRKAHNDDSCMEDWVEFLKRSARRIDALSERFGMDDWVHAQCRLKWRLAGKLARQNDDRWSALLLGWQPCGGEGRSQSRPRTRWLDPIEGFAGGGWKETALDASLWCTLEEVVVQRESLL